MKAILFGVAVWTGMVNGHLAAWHPAMYCLGGSSGTDDPNSSSIVTPLYQLSKADWWFHHINKCDQFPPPAGTFLELPAGGDFTVEIASNRAMTTLSFGGRFMSDWGDGKNHPDDYNVPSCITTPNMHTQNRANAAGTAFAISYQSDIKKVTAENLVVFSVRYHTPWKRVTSYSVPAATPACPPGGCICAWGWVPNGCGQPNMYHQAFKCKVTGATATGAVAQGKPPVWCEDDPSKCVKGAKQMLYWNQAEGNNIEVSGFDHAGAHKSPAYNSKCGFADGAQNDIFTTSSTVHVPASGGKTSNSSGKSHGTKPSGTKPSGTKSHGANPSGANPPGANAPGSHAPPAKTGDNVFPASGAGPSSSAASPAPDSPKCRKRKPSNPPAKKKRYHKHRATTW